MNADYFINKLEMQSHPEGGFFKEIYRSQESFEKDSLPERYKSRRSFSTSIYFLLKGGQISSFHKLKSDEIWHFYCGSSLTIFIIDKNGKLKKTVLGNNIEQKESFQFVIEKDQWFGALVNDSSSFSLIGCTVAPGFDFNDFELGKREMLSKLYPEHKEIIEKLTR